MTRANIRNCGATGTGKRKLLDQVRDAMRVRHRALSTEKAYVYWIRKFILFHPESQTPYDLRSHSSRVRANHELPALMCDLAA